MREQILKQNNALKNQIQAKPEKQFSKTERLKSCQEIILQENILVEKNKMEQDHVEVGLPTKKLALESLYNIVFILFFCLKQKFSVCDIQFVQFFFKQRKNLTLLKYINAQRDRSKKKIEEKEEKTENFEHREAKT